VRGDERPPADPTPYVAAELRIVERGGARFVGYSRGQLVPLFAVGPKDQDRFLETVKDPAVARSLEPATVEDIPRSGIRLLLGYSAGVDGEALVRSLRSAGPRVGEVRHEPSLRYLVISCKEATPALVAQLKALKGVTYLEPDRPARVQQDPAGPAEPALPAGYDYKVNWNLELIRARSAWVSRRPHVLVAVVDSGVDFDHPALKDRVWTYESDKKLRHGFDLVDPANDAKDQFGHGTHVAGIIAAESHGEFPFGVNPTAMIMAVRVAKEDITTSDLVARGINCATDNGAEVINCSLVTERSMALKEAIKKACEKDVMVVAAAGNFGRFMGDRAPALAARGAGKRVNKAGAPKKDEPDDLTYPAGFTREFPNVISVASLNSRGDLAASSNRGFNSVDIAAPGEEILSLAKGPYPQGQARGEPNRFLTTKSGTSQAAAHVSGAASLLLAIGAWPAADIRQVLKQNAARSPKLEGLVGDEGYRLDLSFVAGRRVFDGEEIALEQSAQNLPVVVPQAGDLAFRRHVEQLQKWKTWMIGGMGGGGQFLVLRARFRDAYFPFVTRLVFVKSPSAGKPANDVIELREGFAFLVDDEERTIVRQLDFQIHRRGLEEKNPDNDNSLVVETPGGPTTLLLVVHLFPRPGQNLPLLDKSMVQLKVTSSQAPPR
jgi:subtilisin family serine protease